MQYTDVAIPLGNRWSSPFTTWERALAEVAVTSHALADRGMDPPWSRR
jgi:acetyl-CoA C-acetyltransferase